MPTYNITTQNLSKLQGYIDNAKLACEPWRPLWANLPQNIKEQWKISCPDPVIDLMWKLYQWLKTFFGEA